MYKVNYGSEEVFVSKVLEEAVIFAINLHRSSNCKHIVTVVSDTECIITFEAK